MLVRAFAERLTHFRDVKSQVALFDELARPESLHQLVFAEHPTVLIPAVFDQRQQGLERLRLERYELSRPVKQALPRVDPEGSELIDIVILLAHGRAKNF